MLNKMNANYELGGGWGHHISLMNKDSFHKVNLSKETVKVYGHITPRPSVGQTIIGEFQKSYILFEFVDIKYCADPPDMFFAEIKAIDQELKAG